MTADTPTPAPSPEPTEEELAAYVARIREKVGSERFDRLVEEGCKMLKPKEAPSPEPLTGWLTDNANLWVRYYGDILNRQHDEGMWGREAEAQRNRAEQAESRLAEVERELRRDALCPLANNEGYEEDDAEVFPGVVMYRCYNEDGDAFIEETNPAAVIRRVSECWLATQESLAAAASQRDRALALVEEVIDSLTCDGMGHSISEQHMIGEDCRAIERFRARAAAIREGNDG